MWRRTIPIWVAFLGCAQTPGAPEFEAAEVRVSPRLPDGTETSYSTSTTGRLAQVRLHGGDVQVIPVFAPGGRVTMQYATMRELITVAYQEILRDDYLAGAPHWIDSDRFDLVAKAPPGASVETERLMIQSVLAKRFHLVVHRQDLPMPVYALVVAKNGPKLRPAEKPGEHDGCLPERGFNGEGLHRACRNVTMGVLADRLPRLSSSYVDRPVIDRTGLTGAYDFDLDWMPVMGPADTPGTTIFAALEKQAGLKLEESRHPMPVIVIDRVDRKPTED